MSQLYELSNRLDEDVECMEIEGSVTIKCGDKSDKLSFKSTYENGFLGTSKKDFFWKNGKRPENFEMVFVELIEVDVVGSEFVSLFAVTLFVVTLFIVAGLIVEVAFAFECTQ